jgi:hypothetical protein
VNSDIGVGAASAGVASASHSSDRRVYRIFMPGKLPAKRGWLEDELLRRSPRG